jgi:geranylgeranyl diphosphate synthase type II
MKVKLKGLTKTVDAALKGYLKPVPGHPAVMYNAMNYSVFAGGKRLRPILCLLAAKACGASHAAAMPAACGLEMIHTYSLIHDDLPAMDNDDYRRGKPTSHKKFGEAVAILAGDALLTKAFETVLSASVKTVSPSYSLRAALEIARASGSEGMVGGQSADMINEGKKPSAKALSYIHGHKTGSLITASVVSGAIVAGADRATETKFRAFGERIGLAFQIADDILDITGDEKKMGKKLGKDSGAKKLTYPAVYGIETSKKHAARLVAEAKKILKSMDADTDDLAEIADFSIGRTI